MTHENLSIAVDDKVAVIEIQRPPHNYFNRDILQGIADLIDDVALEDRARSVVLCSAGKNFCAGADFSTPADAEGRTRAAELVYREATRILTSPIPVVAAVQGGAIGGGLGLACAADFRVAGASSWFHANFAKLGFHHGFALTLTLPSIIGAQAARRMLLEAERISATTAAERGLVDELVDDDRIRVTALDLARKLAGNAPLAVRSIRQTLSTDRDPASVQRALEREVGEQAWLWDTQDSAIGIEATRQRAVPQFVAK